MHTKHTYQEEQSRHTWIQADTNTDKDTHTHEYMRMHAHQSLMHAHVLVIAASVVLCRKIGTSAEGHKGGTSKWWDAQSSSPAASTQVQASVKKSPRTEKGQSDVNPNIFLKLPSAHAPDPYFQ
jgi:hypothetical protein